MTSFLFPRLSPPCMNTPTHTYIHSLRVFLPLCGWPSLVHSMHRKLEVSLFMSVEKTRPQSFWLLSAGPHISLLCYQERQNRGVHCSVSYSADSAAGLQTGHSLALCCRSLHGPSWSRMTELPWNNINTFLLNLEQIRFSYLLWLMVLQATHPCVISGLTEGNDIQKQGLIHVKGSAEGKCENTLSQHRYCFCQTKVFWKLDISRELYSSLENKTRQEQLNALYQLKKYTTVYCKNMQSIPHSVHLWIWLWKPLTTKVLIRFWI